MIRLRETWTRAAGWRMFARVSDSHQSVRPPVVLVHGLGVSSRYMIPLALDVARDFRVYAPDLPGFGRSEKPGRALSVPQLASVLNQWIGRQGLGQCLVVGNSMGCQIVVELAAIEPESICGAVLLGPTMDATATHPLSHVWRLIEDQFREPLSLIPLQAFDYVSNGPLRTVQTFRMALRHDMLGRVSRLEAPTVVMRGEHDPIASRAWVEQLAGRMLDASRVEVPGAGHALNYNSPHAVGAVVRGLAARVCAA